MKAEAREDNRGTSMITVIISFALLMIFVTAFFKVQKVSQNMMIEAYMVPDSCACTMILDEITAAAAARKIPIRAKVTTSSARVMPALSFFSFFTCFRPFLCRLFLCAIIIDHAGKPVLLCPVKCGINIKAAFLSRKDKLPVSRGCTVLHL